MGTGNNRCIIKDDHNCRISRSVYNVDCTPCEVDPTKQTSRYVGTTARTTHSRQLEHGRAILGRQASNALYKHQATEHPGTVPDFRASIVRGGFRWNLERQIYEALEIEHQKENPNVKILNSKSEWGNRGLPRIGIETDCTLHLPKK